MFSLTSHLCIYYNVIIMRRKKKNKKNGGCKRERERENGSKRVMYAWQAGLNEKYQRERKQKG